MKHTLLISLMTAASVLSCSGGHPRVPVDSPRDQLLSRLQESVREGKILYGHQDDLVYGHAWQVEDPENDPLERSDVRAVCGVYPALIGFDLGGIELGAANNLDGVPFALIRRAARKQVERGGLVTFSWHPRNPLTGGDAWDVSRPDVVASILPGGALNGEFMQWLSRVADFLETLQDADGTPIPVIFRPWHEHLGSWFWWGARLCTAEQYRELYRMSWVYLHETRGLDQILWCYSPNSNIGPVEYMSRYPGDEFVDLLGMDCYESTDGRSLEEAGVAFSEEIKNMLTYMTALSTEHKKPICLSETGLEGLSDPQWWTGVLYPAVRDFPIAYLLTWRNAHDKPGHFYAAWEGFEHAADMRAFSELDQIVFLP